MNLLIRKRFQFKKIKYLILFNKEILLQIYKLNQYQYH